MTDHRAAINRANSQHSTGPRTSAGKLRASRNALTHGLTGRAVLLPSEDPAAHQRHTQDFFDEYQPQGPTEKQLVQELIDTSWRINRVPALEADLLSRAAGLLEMHKLKGIPYDPAADGFVFSSQQIEVFSQRLIRLNQSRHIEHIRFYAPGRSSAEPARHAS
jgi:hypothetical protein